MKKIFVVLISSVLALSMTGCMSRNGESLENVNTADEPNADNIHSTDYENNLNGLEKYLIELDYIPQKSEPTEMLCTVIGAVAGDRYIFTVNSSRVVVELYEYEPDNLNDDAMRVINEVQKDGEFHVFASENFSDDTYQATLSDNQKYLMIYTDSSESEDNTKRKENVEKAVKAFNGGKTTEKTSSDSKAESSK